MSKTTSLIILFFLLTGCASSYYINEKKELDDSEKRNRYQELEQMVKQIKIGDQVTLLLYSGDIVDGTFYSYMDGFISLRMDDVFRDTELTDIRGISLQPKSRIKTVTMALMFAVMVGIVVTFVVTH